MQTALNKFTIPIQKLMGAPVQGGAGMGTTVYKCGHKTIFVYYESLDLISVLRKGKSPTAWISQLIQITYTNFSHGYNGASISKGSV